MEAKFEVLTAVSVKIEVVWTVENYRRFEGE